MAALPAQPKAPPAGLNVALISEHIARGASPTAMALTSSTSSKEKDEPLEPLRDRYGRAAPAVPPPTRLTVPGKEKDETLLAADACATSVAAAGAPVETFCVSEAQQPVVCSAPEVAPEPQPEFLEFRDGDFYCLLCKQWATEAHLRSKKHMRRAETPEYYLWEETPVPQNNAAVGAHAAANAAAAAVAGTAATLATYGGLPVSRAMQPPPPPPPPPPLPPRPPPLVGTLLPPGTCTALCPRPVMSDINFRTGPAGATAVAAVAAARQLSAPLPAAAPPGLPPMHQARLAEDQMANEAPLPVLETTCSYCTRQALARPIAGTKARYCAECWEWYERTQLEKNQQQQQHQQQQQQQQAKRSGTGSSTSPPSPLIMSVCGSQSESGRGLLTSRSDSSSRPRTPSRVRQVVLNDRARRCLGGSPSTA